MSEYVVSTHEPDDVRIDPIFHIGSQFVTVLRPLVKMTGNVQAAMFLSYIYKWVPYSSNPAGWVYKTWADCERETGMTRQMQRTAQKHLSRYDWWQQETKRVGNTNVLHFRINPKIFRVAYMENMVSTPLVDPNQSDIPLVDVQPMGVVDPNHYVVDVQPTYIDTIDTKNIDTPAQSQNGAVAPPTTGDDIPSASGSFEDAVFDLIRGTYVSAFNDIRSTVQRDMFIDQHVKLAETYGWEKYVRAFRAAASSEWATGTKAAHVERFIHSGNSATPNNNNATPGVAVAMENTY